MRILATIKLSSIKESPLIRKTFKDRARGTSGFPSLVYLSTILALLALTPLFISSSHAAIDKGRHFFCPDRTRNYYEKVYCEIFKTAPTARLPTARDFRNNTPAIQKLMLKPIAKRYNVKLDSALFKARKSKARPQYRSSQNKLSNNVNSTKKLTKKKSTKLPPYKQQVIITEKTPVSCKLMKTGIGCSDQTQFRLASNKENSVLEQGALSDANKMGLKNYLGDKENKQQLSLFMTTQYNQYLSKMLSIGLGSTTLTYNKFVDIFYITGKSSKRFSDRFETMFSTLKKDKTTLGTPKNIPLTDKLTIKHCQQISDTLFACDLLMKNYVFVKT